MNTARRLLVYALLATLAVWFVTEFIIIEYSHPNFAVTVGQGDVWLIYDAQLANTIMRMGEGPGFTVRRTHPFEWFPLPEIDENGVNVPFWMMFLVMLPPWLLLNRAYRKRRRRELTGCCVGCGYDLTGNESDVCSECGFKSRTMLNTNAP